MKHGNRFDTSETSKDSLVMSGEKFERIDKRHSFYLFTENIKKDMYLKCKETLFGNQMILRTCAVCDALQKGDYFVTENSCKFLKYGEDA